MPPKAAAGVRAGQASAGPARRRGAESLDDEALRLRIYAVALCIAFGLDLAVQGPGEGLAFWVPGALSAALLGAGLLARPDLLRLGVVASLALAVAVPLGPEMARGLPMDAILRASPLWPQTLVALFASRVLSEDADLRFARFWRRPLHPQAPVAAESGAAAVALGLFLTLLFYQTIWWLIPARSTDTTLTAIVLNALTGETLIHRAILVLFFVIAGYLVEAGLRHRRDRALFREVRAWAEARIARGEPVGVAELRALLAGPLGRMAHLRTVRLVEEACDALAMDNRAGRAMVAASFDAFRSGARRFLRGLLPLLPMLGFFGTVVGLATAMAALPTSSPEGAGVDISGSLSGLAVKFQTTLLGILASLIASVALALLDKREGELAAECAVFVARVGDGG